MLIEFSVENHRAISKRQTFSMVAAGADLIHRLEPPYHVAETGLASVPRVVVDACLFGANGSGKTSLADAMAFMVDFVRTSVSGGPEVEIDVEPFIFHSEWKDEPSEFEVIFVHAKTIYMYGFVATRAQVIEEWLFVGNEKTDRWNRIFERGYVSKHDRYDWKTTGVKVGRVLRSWKSQTRQNALFLSTAAAFNAEGDLKNAYEWIAKKFKALSASKEETGLEYTIGRFNRRGWKGRVLSFLKDSGVLLDDIVIQKIKASEMPGFAALPDAIQDAIKKGGADGKAMVQFCRDNEKGAPILSSLGDEGYGTRMLFCLAGPILDAIDNGNTIVIDEFDLGLHPLVLKSLVARFCNRGNNKKKAQMIFTSNDPTIVEEAFLERDQVWVVKKGKADVGARLRRWPNFTDSGMQNFVRDYMAGSFGGVPNIRRSL